MSDFIKGKAIAKPKEQGWDLIYLDKLLKRMAGPFGQKTSSQLGQSSSFRPPAFPYHLTPSR